MDRYTASGAIAAVTTGVVGYLAAHVGRHWTWPAPDWMRALSRLVFAVVLAVALSGGLTVAVVVLPLPGLEWLKVLLLVLSVLGPWVVLWGVLKAQRSRLDETCGDPRTAQSLLHTWLTLQIGGGILTSYLPTVPMRQGWNDAFTVLAILMGLGVLFLPKFRREMLELLTPRARVKIKRASRRASALVFGALWLWAYLSSAACPHRQCVAGGSQGFIWALVFSFGSAWLIATLLVQLGAILRWMDDRSRNPGPPPPWFRRLVRIMRRVRPA
jgi:hypothetical protein